MHLILMCKIYCFKHMFELKFLLHPKAWKNGWGKYWGKHGENNDFQKWTEINFGPFVAKWYKQHHSNILG